jgi:hypothetical protein
MRKLNAGLLLIILIAVFTTGDSDSALPGYGTSASLIIKNKHGKVIDGLIISHTRQACIQLVNCQNMVIKNCRLSASESVAISLFNCKNITISNCYIENVSTGVYALESQGIKVLYNRVKNVQGPYPRGQMVQFDDVRGGGNRVSYNRCENISGASNPEDVISMYKTSGTVADPVQVVGNLIRGGGPSKIGGGIMLGDNGGAYIIAKDNILVNPGQYGMAISGGTNIAVTNNKIYSKQQTFTNVGLYIWKQSAVGCAVNTIANNEVNWTNAAGEQNNSWNNGNCGTVAGWDTNHLGANISSSLLSPNFMER